MKKNDMGVSPVIAVILMVAITIVLAGIVTLWVLSLTDNDEESSKPYLFTAEISESDQELVITVMSGELIQTDSMGVLIDGVHFSVPSNITLGAGDSLTLTIPAEVTVESLNEYTIKVTIGNKVVWSKDINAGS